MKRFLLLIIISHILMVRLCGQDSITPAAKAKQVSPLKKEAQVNIDKYIDKSLRDAIDYLDLFLGNVYAPAQNPFFVDLNSFIAGFGAKPGEQRKMLNLFNPLISNELAEYAEKYDNDTIYANESIKKFKMDSIWKRVDSLGLVTFEEYWNWSKKNITSFFAMVSVSTDNSILQQRSDLKRDHRYKNRYTCTFKAYLYRDGGGFMNGTNFSIQAPAIDIPLDFKIALNIDKNKTPSGFAIEEIRLARYIWVDTVPSRNFRINANFQGGYSSAKIDLDKPGIEGSYTGPGNGYSAEFSIDVELLKQQAKPQMIIPGFMLGIGYQST
ncbi:MAG: hypothetical protein NTV01_20400, partial [Bacteroidia bacterium]|nr:hypothetical protein [Bacteroidia bacterium]